MFWKMMCLVLEAEEVFRNLHKKCELQGLFEALVS